MPTASPFHPSDAQGDRAKPRQLLCFTWQCTLSQPASQMMRGIITGPQRHEILMGLARISSPSTHAALAPSLGASDLRALRLQLSARGGSAARCSLPDPQLEILLQPLPACSLSGGTWGTLPQHRKTCIKLLNARHRCASGSAGDEALSGLVVAQRPLSLWAPRDPHPACSLKTCQPPGSSPFSPSQVPPEWPGPWGMPHAQERPG